MSLPNASEKFEFDPHQDRYLTEEFKRRKERSLIGNTLVAIHRIKKRYEYATHKFRNDDFRLILGLIVKDEIDIIETNIRVHSALGVDGFAIVDNGSKDGTREKLEELRKEFDIVIIDQPGSIGQKHAVWLTKLAAITAPKMGADWMIATDADEFVLPDNGTLKQHLNFKAAVIYLSRTNMVLTESLSDDRRPFYESEYQVVNPITYKRDVTKHTATTRVTLSKLGDKAIVNPNGFVRFVNVHSVNHVAAGSIIRKFEPIKIYHYPIRSYDQLLSTATNAKLTFEKYSVTWGPQRERWIKMLEQGQLEDEYRRLIVQNDELKCLEGIGLLVRNTLPKELISSIIDGPKN